MRYLVDEEGVLAAEGLAAALVPALLKERGRERIEMSIIRAPGDAWMVEQAHLVGEVVVGVGRLRHGEITALGQCRAFPRLAPPCAATAGGAPAALGSFGACVGRVAGAAACRRAFGRRRGRARCRRRGQRRGGGGASSSRGLELRQRLGRTPRWRPFPAPRGGFRRQPWQRRRARCRRRRRCICRRPSSGARGGGGGGGACGAGGRFFAADLPALVEEGDGPPPPLLPPYMQM